MPRSPDPLSRHPCPQCGEMLFGTEEKCWKCGAEQPTATEEPAAPAPAEAAQAQAEQPARPAGPEPRPVPPAPTPPQPVAQPDEHPGRTLAIWALVVSAVGLFSCCLPAAPVGLGMAIPACRRGAGGMGVAALVVGIFGTVVWLVWLVFAIVVGATDS